MARTPVVKKNGVVVSAGSMCPRCVHLMNQHDDDKAGHCAQCACVAQDVRDARLI
jgi:ribosomal protein S27AE